MSELDLYAMYLDLGVRLGRSGEDLATWVEDKVRQDMERNDRQIERERKREEMELQKQERVMQDQREERESERQLELRRMELEAQKLLNVTPGTPTPHSNYTKPKLPPLTEFSQVDLYLERFENYAKSMKWQPAGYASCLANLLQVEALSDFLSLGPEDISDYQSVKKNTIAQPCDTEFVAWDHSPTSLSDLKTQATSYLDARPSKSFIKDSATSFAGESVRPTARSDSRRPSIHSYRSQTHTRANTPSLGRHTSRTSSGHRPPTHGVHSFGKSNKPFPTSKDNPRSASHQRNSKGAGSVKSPSDGACYYCGIVEKKGIIFVIADVDRQTCRAKPMLFAHSNTFVASQMLNSIEMVGYILNQLLYLGIGAACFVTRAVTQPVPVSSITGRRIKVNTFCCKNRTFDTAVINISSPYFSGRVEACLLTDPVADVILGDIDGIIHPTPSNSYSGVDGPVPSAYVVTHAQARKTIDNNSQNNMVPSYDPPTQPQLIHTPLNCVPLTDVGSRQKVDPTLKDWFNRVGAPPVDGVYYTIIEDKLLRHYQRAGSDIINTTIAVPESLRHLVLQCAHDNCLSGHSGFKKTLSNIQAYFSWPGILNDVRCYTRSCHVCRVRPRVRSGRPAPFQPVMLVETPFQRVIIDIVRPFPVSQNRYEYILTLVDLSTHWAEGVPHRHISAKDVAQSLFDLFCRLGFPCEIQSDRGQQFMSQVLEEFNSLTNIKHFLSYPSTLEPMVWSRDFILL
ncbi:gypsy retrotransposon integrase-like protein 1 [Plakobranchus ocellatus]|uniref:Gypsy retrotransposon integrase-like protein 1 n=1 Tax=Plakobranchus ocellatus TaxID=259542 RepID=A0AAV4DQU5_9GAST|nr:gypsy retrotransposon integrase-like protein 1 [Plakobranchus ocellatus]